MFSEGSKMDKSPKPTLASPQGKTLLQTVLSGKKTNPLQNKLAQQLAMQKPKK
jgi:hypothetical protein